MTRPHRDLDPRLEVVAEELLEFEQPGGRSFAPRSALRRGPFGGIVLALTNRFLDLAHREVLGDGAPRELLLERAVGGAEQRTGVAHAERAFLHVALDRRRQLQQAQRVRDRRPALADAGRDLVVREREVLDQLLIRRGFLERVQLLALDVLDDRVLEHRGVVGDPDDGGKRLQPDPAGRAPAALARDELVAVVPLAHEHGLEHADLADRLGQRGERLLVEVLARLLRVRPDRRDREVREATRLSATVPVGINAPSPLPSPPGRATAHLLGQLAVRQRPARIESNTVTG